MGWNLAFWLLMSKSQQSWVQSHAASSDTQESDGRRMKQCWNSSKKEVQRRPVLCLSSTLFGPHWLLLCILPYWDRLSADYWADSLKDDWSLSRRSKLVFVERDMGQTNEQQHHFNEWPIGELHGEVYSIQTSFKLLPPAIMESRLCPSALGQAQKEG